MNLKDNIRKARVSIGFSQKQMAASVGKNRGTYQSYEDGRAEPSVHTLIKIAETVGITLDDLVRGNCTPSNEISDRYARLSSRDKAIVDAVMGKS
ncbi:MAG TPA: helix-turn-helix transcriptional regulator [Flavitalea sp.]|nr:helix-turn-helix transcriptional regulator [Flavitalea sp.]